MSKFIEVDTDLGIRSIRIDAITTFAPSESFPSKTEIYFLENSSEPGYINETYQSFKIRLEIYGD